MGNFRGGRLQFFEPKAVELDGGEELESRLLRFANLLEDMTGPLEASRAIIAAGIERSFRTETDPSGNPWKEWSESYAIRVEQEQNRGVHTGRKLQRSEQLREEATSEYPYIISYNSIFFDWDSLPEYAAIQQFGGYAGKLSFIPARAYVGLDQLDKERITAIFIDYLNYISGGTSRSRGAGGRFISVKGL